MSNNKPKPTPPPEKDEKKTETPPPVKTEEEKATTPPPEKKEKKLTEKEEDTLYITSLFGSLIQQYGDPVDGEDKRVTAQRERAIRCKKIIDAKFSK